MTCDFPAAHSMDTAWFAVDDDGHVAMFESGEAGAVPKAGYVGDDLNYDEFEAMATGSAVVFDLVGMRATGYRAHIEPSQYTRKHDDIVAFIREGADLAALIERTGATRVPVTNCDGFGLAFATLDDEMLAELHARDACLGCFDRSESEALSPAERGLFEYAHMTDNVISGPYARARLPATPLRAADLPPSIATIAIKYPGRFADTLELQPAELWACESASSAWIERDGKTVHAFPGHEREARELVAEVGEWILRDTDPRPDADPHVPRPAPRKAWWKLW